MNDRKRNNYVTDRAVSLICENGSPRLIKSTWYNTTDRSTCSDNTLLYLTLPYVDFDRKHRGASVIKYSAYNYYNYVMPLCYAYVIAIYMLLSYAICETHKYKII